MGILSRLSYSIWLLICQLFWFREQKNNGQFRGLLQNLVDDGLSILQYADDTVLFLEDDLEEARNLKLVLVAFEKLSGLKINFHKSEIFFSVLTRTEGKSTWNFSGVYREAFPLDTQGFRCISGGFLINTRAQQKSDSRKNSVLGRGNFFCREVDQY